MQFTSQIVSHKTITSMKLPSMKSFATSLMATSALFLTVGAQASTSQELDKLLNNIKADIAAQRLSTPAGNNALDRIEQYRKVAPYDFRVVPLAYEWGSATLAMANRAMEAKEFPKAQSYLDNVWLVAPLTPGLEAAQDKLDSLYRPKPGQAISLAEGPSEAELERQRKVKEAAEKEKARVEQERRRKLEEEKKRAAEEKKRADEERARRQEEERARRVAAEQAQRAAQQKPTAPAPTVAAAKPVVAPAPATTPVVTAAVAAPVVTAVSTTRVSKLWTEAKEESEAIARYPIAADKLASRDAAVTESLEAACKSIVDNNASVVIHTSDKADYRWLTVRLTLCLRRIDKEFRLRHSHTDLAGNEPYISLHPNREVSLVRQSTD